MIDSKINKLLKALSNEVKKQFGKTLQPKTNPQRLFTYLNNPKKKLDDIDKMAEYVFEKRHANPQKDLHSEGSKLYSFLQKWLIQKELEADKLMQNKLLANALKRHKVAGAYFETLEKREKLIEQQSHRDMWYHLEWMRLSHERYFHPDNDFKSEKIKNYFTKNTQHLDDFYLFARLLHIAEQNSRKEHIDDPKKRIEQEEILTNDYENPLVCLYVLICELIKNSDNEVFINKFCPLLEKNIDKVHPSGQGALATFRINYTGGRVNEGSTEFVREHHKAYKFALDNKYLEHDGYLNSDHYLNAVVTAAVLGEFEEGEKLIQEATNRLGEEAKNVQKLAEAYLYFYKKEFEESDKILKDVVFENFNYDLRVRSLQTQCLYEFFLADKNASHLYSHLQTYEKFVRRKKKKFVEPTTFEGNLNFIQLLKKLIKTPYEAQHILEKNLPKNDPMIAKTWLRKLLPRFKKQAA